ncbi:bifunctional sugar phosphate isomerase/epimerase/4-hydroxyphenylpyruvate dioxygenase family protein [Roseinatronobacter sp. NSM]|uniref:bifunctional sugar phosphate isomerase/epimerase/4-hydroxyphenylpyruvate dioxygenase family protein n=1 Tax=Roseinatronobacter sp. NSM TaxID=3457785 RepID=UPI0040355DAB
MKLSLATVSIAGDLRQKLEAIAAAGLDGVEIFEQDLIASDASPRDIGRMVRDYGLEITLFQPFRDFEGLPEPLRSRAFARAEHKFDLMGELGCDLMLVCSNLHPAARGGVDRCAADLHELGERAARRGLRVGYEALAWGRHVNDHRDAWEIVRRADHPALGLVLDSFHTLARGIDVDTIRRIPGDRIFYVHLADAPRIDMDLLYLSRHFRCMPLEGELDVTGFARAVLATGYDHVFSPEIFNDQFRGGVAGVIAHDALRSLKALLDAARRAEPDLPQPLPVMPAPQQVQDVAFLEFATSGDEEQDLGAFLSRAGFEQAGQHVSKSVALWRQGGINILVNTESKGHAHLTWVNHGTSISEIALQLPDAAQAQARARELGADANDGTEHGPGELSIPALHSLGGGLLRLLDDGPELGRIWHRDFDVRPVAGGAGLTRIDHIGQTMAYDEMLSWSLYYTTLFQAQKSPIVDVIDPGGVVRSQAIKSGGLRLTLNGADTHRTFAGRFIQDSLGASVQHVAFATDDIFGTSAKLAACGFERLRLGANYYADLKARFGLPQELVDRLERESILYDEDEGGSFFQLFSTPRKDGLFFEIVQRDGRYDGYGAPNAPYRIAAQRRVTRGQGMPQR